MLEETFSERVNELAGFLTPREEEVLARFQIGLVPPGIASRRDLARLCIVIEGLLCDCAQMEMDIRKLKGG